MVRRRFKPDIRSFMYIHVSTGEYYRFIKSDEYGVWMKPYHRIFGRFIPSLKPAVWFKNSDFYMSTKWRCYRW